MNTQNQSSTRADYSTIAIPLTQTDIKKAARGNKPAEGWYRFTVSSSKADVSKNGGSMMFVNELLITDKDGNTKGRPIRDYLVLPIATPQELLTAKGFPDTFTHTAPNTFKFVRDYLQASRPAEFPYDPEAGPDTAAVKEEKAAAILSFLTAAWATDGQVFVGDVIYGKLEDASEGRPEIVVMRATLPSDETLVVA